MIAPTVRLGSEAVISRARSDYPFTVIQMRVAATAGRGRCHAAKIMARNTIELRAGSAPVMLNDIRASDQD